MSHLLPQFNCLPDTFSLHSKFHLHSPTLLSTKRWHTYFGMQCMLYRTSPQSLTTTTVLDMVKLRLTSLEAYSNLAAAHIPCVCAGAIGSPTETNFGAGLATETLPTGEEAITNATAAEAVALAKAAANVSEDARMMFSHYISLKLDGKQAIIPSDADTTQLEDLGLVGVAVGSTLAENGLGENCYPTKEADDLEQILEGVAVRSRSKTERKARREKAAEKAYTCVKSVGRSPKIRAFLASGDYYDPVGYFNGSTPRLLTYTEEYKLSQGIQDLHKIEKLGEELDDGATFAEWAAAAGIDEKTLRYRLDHGIRCRDRMIRSNVGLVVMVAKYYQGPGRDLGELVQVGCHGLVRAAERFDPRKGKFSSYAPWWIRLAIQKFIYHQSSSIRIPANLVEELRKVKAARNRLYSKNGRPPSKAQVAKETRLSMNNLQFLLLLPEAPKSLDQKRSNQDFEDWQDEIESFVESSPEDELRRACLRKHLEKELDKLRPKEKQVIKLRFGMESGRPMTLQEIGDIMDVTRERIRQIEVSALQKLKNNCNNEVWQGHLAPG